MRAVRTLQEKLQKELRFMHAKRVSAFWRAVEGVLLGQRLWLTALGRSLPGASTDKHRIKAIDRFVGSPAVQASVVQLYAVLAKALLRHIRRPVVLVDWTGIDPRFGVLTATLSFRGRALPLFARTFPKKRKCSPPAEREFLDALALVLPPSCRPILVTDAGFLYKWFDAVRERGWDFVGRIRNRVFFQLEQQWIPLDDVFCLSRRKPRDLGNVLVGRQKPREYRVVLSPISKPKGRKKIGRAGLLRQSTADHQRRAAARDPWVLVTSLSDSARAIVDVYGTRMQIEQSFRDTKSHRNGWSAKDIRSRCERRVDVLLLLGAFATVAAHVIGFAATALNLHSGFQANTVRSRRVLSTFTLGILTIRRRCDAFIGQPLLRFAFRELRTIVFAAALPRATTCT